jgi:hypothetical protein
MFFGEAPDEVRVIVVVATGVGSGVVGVLFFSHDPVATMEAVRNTQAVLVTRAFCRKVLVWGNPSGFRLYRRFLGSPFADRVDARTTA